MLCHFVFFPCTEQKHYCMTFSLKSLAFLSIILFKESSYVNLYSLICSILAYQKLKNCWRSKKWSNKPFILILSFSLNWVRYSHTNIYNKPEENSMNKPRIGFIHEHSLHKIFFLNTYTVLLKAVLLRTLAPDPAPAPDVKVKFWHFSNFVYTSKHKDIKRVFFEVS